MATHDPADPRVGGPPSSAAVPDTEKDVWSSPGMTIEQRYELEATLASLELEDPQIGIPIGSDERYLLRSLLGRGSMGAVYLAEDVELEREVAIKVVSRCIEHKDLALKLRREARALAAIDHPNVLKVFDIGREHDERFIAMEYAAGQTLRAWQRDRPLGRVLDAYLHAGVGLAAIHRRGLVHRDFKPDNVLVDEHEGRTRVRVGDFGLADLRPEPPAAGSEPKLEGLQGTLPYMAPEQLRGEPADARSDQHQFCVSLWEAVAGQRPFGAPGRSLDASTALPARAPAMPRWLHRVLRRGLAFEPGARYRSMDRLLVALRRGRRWQQARLGLVLGAAVGTVALVVHQMQPEPCEAAARPMAEIWSDEARADIQAAFGARSMGDYLVDRLEHVAAEWSERAVEVCRAREDAPATERPALERRAVCLDRWVDRVGSRIEWLRHPEDGRTEHAFELVAPLAGAGDSCALPPTLIDVRVERALEQAEQAELLRDLDHAKALAVAAVDLATTYGAPCPAPGPDGAPRSSEQAAAYYRLGHVLSERRESEASIDALVWAHQHAHACADEHRDAEAEIHAAKVLASDMAQLDAASAMLDDAWVSLQHVEEPQVSLRRYDERMAAGILAERKGEYAAARRHAERARAALGDTADPVLEAKLELNIGIAWHGEGRYAEAAAAYERAKQRLGRALGPDHPQVRLHVARRELNLGLAAQERGEHEPMRRHFERATSSSETPVVAKGLIAWAQAELEAGDEEAASERAKALLVFLAGGPELSPVTLAIAETTAGQILAALEDPGSIPVLRRACAQWQARGGPDELAACELSLGGALLDAGQREEAERIGEHLRSLEVSTAGPLPQVIEDFGRSLEAGAGDLAAAVDRP